MKILFLLLLAMTSCQNQLHKIDTLAELSETDLSESASNTLTIMALNVGQGDATLIQTPDGLNYLIDAGPPESGTNIILPLLDQLDITLDAIFVSHYDSDHIGGMAEVISGEDGELHTEDDLDAIIYDRGGAPTDANTIFENYLEAATPYRTEFHAGDQLSLEDGVTVTCLILNGELADGSFQTLDDDDENGRSMGLLIEYGNFRYWTSGDLTGGGFEGSNTETLVAPLIGDVDVLHVNHHGSLTSSHEDFLDILSPEAAIISAGTDNDYGHPDPEIIARLLERDIDVYLTSQSETLDPEIIHQAEEMVVVEVSKDGEEYEVKVE